jgi:hypothetical protein
MRYRWHLITLLLLLFGSGAVVFAQPIYHEASLQGYDSIDVDPLKVSEAGIVTANKRILSLKAATRMLAKANEEHNNEAAAIASLHIADAYIAHGNNNNAFLQLEHTLKTTASFLNDQDLAHLYYNLAIVFARQKKYAAAMKCFYKTGYVYQQTFFKRKRRHFFTVDTSATLVAEPSANSLLINQAVLNIFSDSLIDADIFNVDTAVMINNPVLEESPDIDYATILNTLDDGKEAVGYSILLHIKQPIPGKKNIFVRLSKVGHTFITLLKFNADSSVVSRTFGFYPQKNSYLAATPVQPSTGSVFKNDALHDWDEMIGKFISQKQFESIIAFIDKNGDKNYNLNHNNCTDIGLKIAAIANIEIEDTRGAWPLGRGNNPASTGQSILKGKFKNMDTNTQHGLFACSNNLFIKRGRH